MTPGCQTPSVTRLDLFNPEHKVHQYLDCVMSVKETSSASTLHEAPQVVRGEIMNPGFIFSALLVGSDVNDGQHERLGLSLCLVFGFHILTPK